MENLQIERIKQAKDKESESIFQKLYLKHIIKEEYEFGVRTNELIDCDKENLPEGYGFPDFLLKINDEIFIAEITTSHDLDDPNAKTPFRPGQTQITNPWKQIFDRINRKMTKGNFKNVDDFYLPIIFVVFNNGFSSQIDEMDIDIFMNDLKKYSSEIQNRLLSMPENDYACIEKVSKHNLISGTLFVKSESGSNQIRYFPHDSSHKKLSAITTKTLENPH